ncbi:MAG: von Willebrand factor type A domain-containing protein [Flavobacteriia bacterium]|nr:von Willebrand factor type A domain-containing protein [Flavobacteriia bacterium]
MKLKLATATTILVLLFYAPFVGAQTQPGSLKGVVKDKVTGETIPQIIVELRTANDSAVITRVPTDFDGNYNISPITPGTYMVHFKGDMSYEGLKMVAVKIPCCEQTVLNAELHARQQVIANVEVVWERPLAEESRTSTRQVVDSENISNLASRDLSTATSTAARASQSITIRGTRADANQIFVDGVKVRGGSNVPREAIESVQVIRTNGTPAQYSGDAVNGMQEVDRYINRYRSVTVNHPRPQSPSSPPSPPVILPSGNPHDTQDREEYNSIHISEFLSPLQAPLSTFGMDVDKASYFNVRRIIEQSGRVPVDAVRPEEFINSFEYAYQKPEGGQVFDVTTELSVCPWNADRRILRITLNTERVEKEDLPPSNLVFLIDVSGSMHGGNRLGLIQESLYLLTEQLSAEDRISIVTYASGVNTVLESTPGNETETIKRAISGLQAGGSTNGEGGIQRAYAQAMEGFIEGGANRVILCTDGDFNVGISSQDELIEMISEKRESNIFLSVIGVGQGNYREGTMEQLANKGNGNFNYFHDLYSAKKVFIEEFSSTLFTVAKDAKVQVEFNPLNVAEYRLLGYENRVMPDEDFHDDTKDGGEVGMGHQVTMLYEIVPGRAEAGEYNLKYQEKTPIEVEDEIATISLRYKEPEAESSSLAIFTINNVEVESSSDQRFATAVAAFAGYLQGDDNIEMEPEDIIQLAREARGDDLNGDRSDFVQLVQLYRELHANK